MSRRLKCTIVITRCPSSVCPSLTFHIFAFSKPTGHILTKLYRMQVLDVLYQVCVFFVPIGHPRWPPRPLIGWNIFRLLLRNRWMDFDKTWQEVSPQRPLPSLCFSSQSVIQDDRPGLWFAKTFFDFSATAQPREGGVIWQRLTLILQLLGSNH